MWTLRRSAARVVLLDAEDRVLLIEASDPVSPRKGTWWELPGGGIEHGEPSGEAAARELFEETGIDGASMGPCVWRHHAKFTFAGFNFDQDEHIHLARLEHEGTALPAPPDPGYRPGGLEAIEAMAFKGVRWWGAIELANLVADGGKVIPPWLPEQLAAVLDEGVPAEPIDLGDLGDAI